MAYQSRTPSVKIVLDKSWFNLLINTLDYNQSLNSDYENYSMVAGNLKNKLMRYSIPKVNDDGIELVDIRFFPGEASDMIFQLLSRVNDIELQKDFYEELVNSRESK